METTVFKKVLLVILDGFGVASFSRGNAVALAKPKTIDYLIDNFPSLTLQASGPIVGLPWGEMGNSEVGHLNIGAGRIVGQDQPRITAAIADRSFFKNPTFKEALEYARTNNSRLHLVGMVSSGGVHSLDQHLYALLGMAEEFGMHDNIFIHMFTDGRDTQPKVAREALLKLEEKIKEIGVTAKIATITGRFYAMDRGRHWEQTELTYQALVNGIGEEANSPIEAIENNYRQNIHDEMIRPTVIMTTDSAVGSKTPIARIREKDAVIFFNFRQDRMIQLVQAFLTPQVMEIASKHEPIKDLFLVSITKYASDLPTHVAFPQADLHNNLAEVISSNGLTQLHIAESEKYAHITSFFNGGRSEELKGEERIIVTSPNNTKNYIDHPQMSADELTSKLIDKLIHSKHSFYVANYANCDMVGHTGDLRAAVQAVECIDKNLKLLSDVVLSQDCLMLITGDHGNVEQMLDMRTGSINKDHSTNPVPFIAVASKYKLRSPKEGGYLALANQTPSGVISDVAPTVLVAMGQPVPKEMTGVNLTELF